MSRATLIQAVIGASLGMAIIILFAIHKSPIGAALILPHTINGLVYSVRCLKNDGIVWDKHCYLIDPRHDPDTDFQMGIFFFGLGFLYGVLRQPKFDPATGNLQH